MKLPISVREHVSLKTDFHFLILILQISFTHLGKLILKNIVFQLMEFILMEVRSLTNIHYLAIFKEKLQISSLQTFKRKDLS